MADNKSKMTKIYSQASNDIVITMHEAQDPKVQSARVIEKAIIIKGGANVAHAVVKGVTQSKYAVSDVTAEELKILQDHPAFMRKVKRGFITIGEAPAELKADKSAQLTEKQMATKTKAKAKTGPVAE